MKVGRLQRDDYLTVVGAGFGGLTVASAAARVGARVRVIDGRPQAVDLQRGCDHRWLHPHVYDWPAEGSDNAHADVLFLDWRAAAASRVVERLEAKWNALAKGGSIQESFSTVVNDLRQIDGGWILETEPACAVISGERCKLVVLAIGFGIEKRLGPRPLLRYWDRDNLHRFPLEARGTVQYLIAGSGDGALIDTVRAKVEGFRHDKVLRDFKLMGREMRETRERIAAIENEARHREDAAEYLRIEYARLVGTQVVDDALRRRARERVQVVLVTRAPHIYSLQSTALNRFLVSRLIALGLVEHRRGELVEVSGGTPARVRMAGADDELEFYDVVTRIGPVSPLAYHLRSIEDLCPAGRGPGDHDPTRVPGDWSSLRSRSLSSPPLNPRVVSVTSTFAYYATSRLAALRIVSSGTECIVIDAEDRKSFKIHDGEGMAYYFFLELEQARQYAIGTFGAEGAAVVGALVQEPPSNGDGEPMRPKGPEGAPPMRATYGGLQFILITDLSYVTSPRLVPAIEGEDK